MSRERRTQRDGDRARAVTTVEAGTGRDALDLARRLPGRCHWYIVERDRAHWDVCIGPSGRESDCDMGDVLDAVSAWTVARRLTSPVVHLGR